MNEVTVLVETNAAAPEAVHVTWHRDIPPIPAAAQARIDERWAHYLEEPGGAALFDAPITWLISAKQSRHRIALELAPARYKDFLVTVLRDRPWFQIHAPEAMRPALGNSVLLTHANRALLGIRSQHVSVYAGRAHLLGGVLDQLTTSPAAPPPTAAPILAHLLRELQEEAAITPADLRGEPRLLAILRDEFLAQPELAWQWETTTDLSQIGARFAPHEHTACLLVTKDPIPPSTLSRLTPIALAAWQRWRRTP